MLSFVGRDRDGYLYWTPVAGLGSIVLSGSPFFRRAS